MVSKIVQTDQFSLSKYDWKSLAIGVGITATGAILTYILEWFTKQDFGTYGPIVMVFVTFIVNLVRKYIGEAKYIA